MLNEKIELGLDVSGNPASPFVTLNDPVKGLLGSTEYVLGGTLFYDVTQDVINYGINRGKSRQLDRYNSGNAVVTFRNENRKYDPLYTAGPYAGQIIPRRPIRISSNDIVQYVGTIDDWDLQYSLGGESTASIACSDGMTSFANQSLGSAVQTVEYSGARINKILSNENVQWNLNDRVIDTGKTLLQADTIQDGTSVLQYIQTITETEPGSFYIDKLGNAKYRDRYSYNAASGALLFTDNGSGIPYSAMSVIYGTELLYNNIEVNQKNGVTVSASDATSQDQYGIIKLTLSDLLMQETSDATNLAVFLARKYSTPEYRFEEILVILNKIDEPDQDSVLALDLGDVVQVSFTPNGIGSPITKNVEIISISHNVTAQTHTVSFKFGSLEYGFWRLSDPVFGRLSAGNSLAY